MTEALVTALIRSQFPGAGLDLARLRYLSEGEDFKVFECDGWAWRFPKRAEVEPWLLREGPMLEAIRSALGVAVPSFSFRGNPENGFPYSFVGYRMLHGTPADQLNDAATPELAAAMGRFLSELHAVPVDLARQNGAPDGSVKYSPAIALARVRKECGDGAPAALPESSHEACAAFLTGDLTIPSAPAHGDLRLIHADLEAEHIVLDPSSRRITGILDWSDACIGDPVRDFGGLWAWGGETFLNGMLAAYTCPRDTDFVPRLKFLGKCFALLDYQESLGEGEQQIAFSLRQLDNVFRN